MNQYDFPQGPKWTSKRILLVAYTRPDEFTYGGIRKKVDLQFKDGTTVGAEVVNFESIESDKKIDLDELEDILFEL